MTDFEHTEPIRDDFGTIDHIALSVELAESAVVDQIWGPNDAQGQALSDHSGVCVVVELE